MQFSNYDHSSFDTLNSFDLSKKLLSENREYIEQLGEIIKEYDLEENVGVCLLHKHFELKRDEILVETITESSITIQPEIKSAIEKDVIPYMWRLIGLESGLYEWKPLEFVRKDSVSDSVISISENICHRKDFLQAFQTRLLSLGLATVFGLSLHHRSRIQFDRKIKILLETEDEETRIMQMNPTDRQKEISLNSTQTLWRFPKCSTKIVESLCDLHGCAGHCGDHSGPYP